MLCVHPGAQLLNPGVTCHSAPSVVLTVRLQVCASRAASNGQMQHVWTSTRLHLQGNDLKKRPDKHALDVYTAVQALSKALILWLHGHADGESAQSLLWPVDLSPSCGVDDFSMLLTVPKQVCWTISVPSMLAMHKYAVVPTSARRNSCMFYAVAKALLHVIQTRGIRGTMPEFFTKHGVQLLQAWPACLFKNARQDKFLDTVVDAWRLDVRQFLEDRREALDDRYRELDPAEAQSLSEDLQAEIACLRANGFVGWRGALPALRTVLQEQDPTWWLDTGIRLIYFGNSQCEPGVAGNTIEVLPFPDQRERPSQYVPAQRRRKKLWSARIACAVNVAYGVVAPTVMHDMATSDPDTVAVIGNMSVDHFEAILHVPHAYPDAEPVRAKNATGRQHIAYDAQETTVSTIPVCETMRFFSPVPRLRDGTAFGITEPDPAVLQAKLMPRLWPPRARLRAPDHDLTTDDDARPAQPNKETAPAPARVERQICTQPPGANKKAHCYDFTKRLPASWTAAISAAATPGGFFGSVPGKK